MKNHLRKALSLALALVLCLGLLPVAASAAASDFVIENGVLTKYNGSGGDVGVPAGVTEIGPGAFQGCDKLKSVTVPSGVTTIGDRAFIGCSNLSGIILPEGLTTIGNQAFAHCHGIASITIPSSVTSIAYYAFAPHSGDLTIYGVAGSYAETYVKEHDYFFFAVGQDTADIPVTSTFTVTSGDFIIEQGVLTKYTGPGGDVVIPDGVTEIADRIFSTCDITSVTIPYGVTKIGIQSFQYCRELTSVTLPSSLTEIGNGAFENCTALTSIAFPDSLTSIGAQAFSSCKFTSVTIPYNVKTVGRSAFEWCENLQTVVLTNPDTDIWGNSFEGTPWLNAMGDPVILNNTFLRYRGSETEVTIPAGITKIASAAFYEQESITKIIVPNSVTEIGEWAFSNCRSLATINIPDGVTEIGNSTFAWCQSLANIHIPNGVTQIGENAFYNTALPSISLPPNIKVIERSSFSSCDQLTSITIPDGVERIDRMAFAYCDNLTSAIIPASVTEIGDTAFTACKALTIYCTPNSAAETYAKRGYDTLSFYGPITYQPIPYVANLLPTAYASTQAVDVDGKKIVFECYALKDANGYDTNYIKLRDLAMHLNGTAAQFDVGWDGSVTITTGRAYTPNGSELSTPFSGNRGYQQSNAATRVDGRQVSSLNAIVLTDDNGGGYTYYKLRDLGNALGFTVDWSAERGIFIETK